MRERCVRREFWVTETNIEYCRRDFSTHLLSPPRLRTPTSLLSTVLARLQTSCGCISSESWKPSVLDRIHLRLHINCYIHRLSNIRCNTKPRGVRDSFLILAVNYVLLLTYLSNAPPFAAVKVLCISKEKCTKTKKKNTLSERGQRFVKHIMRMFHSRKHLSGSSMGLCSESKSHKSKTITRWYFKLKRET